MKRTAKKSILMSSKRNNFADIIRSSTDALTSSRATLSEIYFKASSTISALDSELLKSKDSGSISSISNGLFGSLLIILSTIAPPLWEGPSSIVSGGGANAKASAIDRPVGPSVSMTNLTRNWRLYSISDSVSVSKNEQLNGSS